MNQLRRILKERKQVGKLFHFTTLYALSKILKTNTLKSYMSDREKAVSLSRGWEYHGHDRYTLAFDHYEADVRLTLDGDKLSEKYKIVPALGGFYGDDAPDSIWRPEREERIFSDIKDIDKYILRIDFVINHYEDEDYNDNIDYYEEIKRVAKKLATKYPVEVNTNGKFNKV